MSLPWARTRQKSGSPSFAAPGTLGVAQSLVPPPRSTATSGSPTPIDAKSWARRFRPIGFLGPQPHLHGIQAESP
eukprot:13751812-Alexandrium_andersonii.AAC.1